MNIMGFLQGLINNEEEKNNKRSEEGNEHDQKAQEEYWNRLSGCEEEKQWQEEELREEEYQERLKTSEKYYLKAQKLHKLIKFPDNIIEQKVLDGELTFSVIDEMKFYLSKIDRTALRRSYEGSNWEVIKDNIDYFEELTYVRGKLISRLLNK